LLGLQAPAYKDGCIHECRARQKVISMSRKLVHILCVGLIAGGVACGDDDDDNVADGGPDGGTSDSGVSIGDAATDGGGGTGGKGGGTGGMSGGTGGSGDIGDVYECKPPAPEKGGTAKTGEACCEGLGVCTKNASGTGAAGYGLDKCAAGKDLKCVPVLPSADFDAGDDDGGASGPIASCRVELPATLGDFDLEGRCVPGCFITGDPSAANLGQSSCNSGSKCVPCYSPVTGESTGACEQDGDSPTESAPPGFAECGDGIGYCVSADTVMMTSGMAMLPQLTCDADQVCAPKVKVIDQKACFAHCDSVIGGPGACIAAYIVPEATRGLLQQSTCEDGEKCAPCINPTDMKPTGACR
jgi:hypothetical protein